MDTRWPIMAVLPRRPTRACCTRLYIGTVVAREVVKSRAADRGGIRDADCGCVWVCVYTRDVFDRAGIVEVQRSDSSRVSHHIQQEAPNSKLDGPHGSDQQKRANQVIKNP